MLNRVEAVGWVIAIMGIIAMGVLTFAGPFRHINKEATASGIQTNAKATIVKIVSNPATSGLYKPAKVTVKTGQPVTWVNVSDADHTATARDNQTFNSGNIAQNGARWTYTPSKPGTYKYICVYHPKMLGTLIVQG